MMFSALSSLFFHGLKGQNIIAQGIVSGGTNRNDTLGNWRHDKNRPHNNVEQSK